MGVSPRRSGRSAAVATTTTSPPSPRKRRNSYQSYNQSPPRQQPLTSPPPDEDEDDEDDGSAEITRCVCGSQEYPYPDADIEDTGFMICCERCNVWQHGPCVGVMSENEAPDIYFCEECRPDLHELSNRHQGHRQSRWIGSSIPAAQPTRRKKSSASLQLGSSKGSISPPPTDEGTSSKERKPSPKKRSTMNSRDAAYTYTSLFPAPSSVDDDHKMDDATSPPASRSGESRSRRRGKRLAEDDEDDPPRSSKRRRESNETDSHEIDRHPNQQPLTIPRKPKSTKRTKDIREIDSDAVDQNKDDSSSEHHTPLLDAPPAAIRNGKRPLTKRKMKTDRVDSEEPPTPTLRKEQEIRPARARIPQARSGLNEMRKRVGAIMEFVGRLQADITPTGEATPIDPDDEIEKPDMEAAPSAIIMQYVTKRCLDFEVQFGKYPGRYG